MDRSRQYYDSQKTDPVIVKVGFINEVGEFELIESDKEEVSQETEIKEFPE
jgi:hypothetical protein